MTGGLVLLKILEEMLSEVNVNHSELEITCRLRYQTEWRYST